MDNRPIKGNHNGQYNMNFIDPTNDIAAYYDGHTELEHLLVTFFLFSNNTSRQWSSAAKEPNPNSRQANHTIRMGKNSRR